MSEYHQPLSTDPRSYEFDDGDVLPLEIMIDPQPQFPDFSEYPFTPVKEGEFLSSTQKMIQKAIAEQALGVVESFPIVKNVTKRGEVHDAQTLSSAEALIMLSRGNGFYPRDLAEKNSLLGISGRSADIKYPVIRYLYELEQHQENNNVADPEAVLRAVVRQFADDATQAAMEIRMAKLFERTRQERNFADAERVSDAISVSYLEDDPPTRRTLTTIARMREADLFVEGKGANPLFAQQGIDALVGKRRTARIFDLLGAMRISNLMKMNTRMMNEENNRFYYWRDRVSESKMYGKKINSVSTELLMKLDELKPAKKEVVGIIQSLT
jgi:hypothetical protein